MFLFILYRRNYEKNFLESLVASSFLLSSANAADFYLGLEGSTSKSKTTKEWDGNNSSNSEKYDNDTTDARVNLGWETASNNAFQFYFANISYDDKPWFAKEDKMSEFGFEFIKKFKAGNMFYPYFKVGLGVGFMDTDPNQNFSEDTIISGVGTLGAGVDFKVAKHISLLTGLDYKYRVWQDVEVYNYKVNNSYYNYKGTISTTESNTRFYVGLNFVF